MHIFKTTINQWIHDKRGVAAVEFAMIAPVLIFLVVATLDYGFYINEQMKLQATARTTADFVMNTGSTNNAQNVATQSYAGNNTITATIEFSCQCADAIESSCPLPCDIEEDDYQRRFVNVSVAANHATLFPYPGIADSLNLLGYARLRVD